MVAPEKLKKNLKKDEGEKTYRIQMLIEKYGISSEKICTKLIARICTVDY